MARSFVGLGLRKTVRRRLCFYVRCVYFDTGGVPSKYHEIEGVLSSCGARIRPKRIGPIEIVLAGCVS